MNEVEIYGNLIKEFIQKMTSPEIGQFRLEISTFRIILERARVQKPVLIKFSITENGKVVNDLDNDEESLIALETLLKRSVDFISSLIGEELARDIIIKSLRSSSKTLIEPMRGKEQLISYIPEPFDQIIEETMKKQGTRNDHEDILGLFEDVFQAYLKDLANHTDLSAFKLKLSILREKHELLKHVVVTKNKTLDFDRDMWASASDDDVKEALVAAFNSMVGLSTFLVGKEEAIKKATRVFQYYFEGKSQLLERYDMKDVLLEGALHQKISSGLPVLDNKLGGGIPKGSSILFLSPSGIERDIFISGLLTGGLENGYSVLNVLSKEPPRSIRMLLRSQGLDAEKSEEEGHLRIVDWFSWRGERIIGVEKDGYALKSSKILSNLGIAINKGLRELSFSTNKLALVHIIGPAMNIFEFSQVYNFIQRLRAKFKEEEMASIFFLESETLSKESVSRITEVFDGVIEMSKTMDSGKIRRELSILTMSSVDFDANPIPFVIRDNALVPIVDVEADERIKLNKTMGQKGTKTDKHEIEEVEEADEGDVELLSEAIKKGHLGQYMDKQKESVEIEMEKPKDDGEDMEVWVAPRRKHDQKLMKKVQKVISGSSDDTMSEKVFKKVVRRRRLPPDAITPKKTRIVKKAIPKKIKTEEEEEKVRRKKTRKVIKIEKPKPKSKWDPIEEIGDKPEEILMEAIATIDDLLEGSEISLNGSVPEPPPRRKK